MKSAYQAAVIEDDEDLSFIFAEALHVAGFDPTVLNDGKSALDYLGTASPDIVILDLHLPYVPGPEILDYIRHDQRLQNAHVIVTTADVALSEVTNDRADFTLLKPISFTMLRDLTYRLRQVF